MKKIVGAVLAATMLAGTAMADIGFSYTGSNYFTTSGGNLKYVNDDRTDCLSVTMSNAAGGVVVDFDIDGGSLVEDEYYGWINFTLPFAQLQMTAGAWNGRYVNRVRADAGDLKAADFEKFKPGVINGTTGKDSDNLTGGAVSVVAAFTNQDVLPGTLMGKIGLVKSTYNPDADAAKNASESGDATDGDLAISAGFVGELAYRQDGLVNLNLAIKNLVKNNFSFGLWVSPMMVDKLSLTLGGTVATVKDWDKTAKEWSDLGVEWGIDLRARYKIADGLSVTTMHNLSSAYSSADDDSTMKLWNMLNATYAIADNLTTGLTLNMVTDNVTNNDFADARNISITVSPSLVIQATEKVTVTTALRAEWENVDFAHWTENLAAVTIPVIFSFSY